MSKINFKEYLIHLIAIGIFVIVSIIYFIPQLSGKKINQGDLIAYMGMSQEVKEYHKQTGIWSQWTNSGFGGMPAYQIHSTQPTNLTIQVRKALSLWIPRPIGLFVFGCICFYLMALVLGVEPWLGIVGAIAFSFTTNNVVLFEAGHNTKVLTIMTCPLVIAGVLRAYRGKLLSGLSIFALGLSLCLAANHPQMTYYLAILLGIYVLYQFVSDVKKQNILNFAKTSGFLLIAALIALGTSASKLLTTYEYGKDTMRGAPILKTEGKATSSSEVEGLEWNYATAWSNGFKDLWSSYIPLAVGGSVNEKIDKNSAFAKELRSRGMARGEASAPLYFGAMTSTSGPIYFGAIICYLFLLCFPFLEPKVKWWAFSAVLLTSLLSMGKNMEALYRIFFDYFPLFNKFRTPNSILSVTAAIIPLIGILSIDAFLKKDKSEIKITQFLIPALILIISGLLYAYLGPSIMSMQGAYDAQFSQAGLDVSKLIDLRMNAMQASAWRSIFLIGIAAGIMFAYLKGKLNKNLAIILIGLFAIGDLMQINKRYVSSDDFVTSRSFKQNFPRTAADEQILKDKDLHYRVFDTTGKPWSSSNSSYYHKTIGGMHAAKLQRYDDMISKHLSKGNQAAFNMLNTKYYIVQGQEGRPSAQLNNQACGNAWFVDDIKIVNSANEEIDALNDINPLSSAVIHPEFKQYINGLNPNKNGSISLTKYAPNKLEYKSNASSEQLAIFSEVWYGPNKGWQAYIDDQPVDHIRANYVLRALKIPAGNHSIVFEFAPKSYALGNIIGLICSLIILGGLGFLGYLTLNKKNRVNF